MTARLVSAIVPCRNERAHIEAFCASVLAQRLPPGWALEVIVADGASDDGTRERLAALAAAHARLSVVDNPRRIVSTGLNRALERARGDVVVRLDVHTTYAADYIAEGIAALERRRADNVGGPWRAVGEAPWQRAIAAAFQSRWVAGGARSRQLDYEGPCDTVYLGCWPRASFDRYGLFDETLVRNQDDEHNLRIVRGGGRVWQSARMRSEYRPRASLASLWRQWLQYGYWKPFVMRRHGQPAAWRHLAPAGLVLGQAVLVVLALAGLSWRWPLAWGAAYLGMLALLTALVLGAPARGANSAAAPWRLWWRLPLVIATQHLAYGLGSIAGAWDAMRGRTGRERFASLTR